VRRHGDQAQSGAQADAVGSHLIHVVFQRGKSLCRRSPCQPIAPPAFSAG
jgi:hypothetical protein